MLSRYGLIGYPLSHSFSKKYFTDKFRSDSIDAVYELFPLKSMDEFKPLLEKFTDLKGLNVTIPYKRLVMEMLDEISDEALLINAVNTIKISHQDNKLHLKGFNTDAPAFESELIELAGHQPANALILGTGGASSAVAFVLNKLKWEFKFVSRQPTHDDILSYQMVDEKLVRQTKLIINTTPVGMYPNMNKSPMLPYHALSDKHSLFDLVYNPELTDFLRKGKQQGAKISNGLGMLHKQAELAWKIWQQ